MHGNQRVGGSGMDIRSKARVYFFLSFELLNTQCFIHIFFTSKEQTISGPVSDPSKLPKWNYDGSSTDQAPGIDSEVML